MVSLFILFLFLTKCSSTERITFENKANDSSIICITEILRKYFTHDITFVDINSEDSRLIEALHSSNVSVITRNTAAKLEVYNDGYVIQARNITDFVQDFKYLTKERPWNPRAKFLIVLDIMDKNNVTAVFDELLRVHVINVLVINGSDGGDIYTYNPFENYGCGRRYDEVISCGTCKYSVVRNLYPDKLVTKLQNCTFRANLPFLASFDVRSRADKSPANAEITLLETIAWLEHFNLDVTFTTSEGVGDVDDDFNVTGYLKLIQDNETDMVLGFKTLSQSRASAFDYIHWHYPFADALVYVVAKAPNVPSWKYIYIEFNAVVWILIVIVFILCSVLANFIIRDSDMGLIVLNMWEIFLGHGDAQSKKKFRHVLLQWLWFSYLIGCFYQSSLCSFTVHPKSEHQVSSEEELTTYNFKPCINNLTRKFIRLRLTLSQTSEERKDCDSLFTDSERVSNSEGLFSITFLSMLRDHRNVAQKLFLFEKPYYKISYSIYLYKGFPMFEKLEVHTLRLRENGLAEKFLNDIYLQKEVQQYMNASRENKEYEPLSVVPWIVYGFGVILASAAFVLEVYFKNRK